VELHSGRTKIAESLIRSLPVTASAVNPLGILDAILVGLVAALFRKSQGQQTKSTSNDY
jgi:hypothetical protein